MPIAPAHSRLHTQRLAERRRRRRRRRGGASQATLVAEVLHSLPQLITASQPTSAYRGTKLHHHLQPTTTCWQLCLHSSAHCIHSGGSKM